jgi:hypothetical protein
LTQLVRDSKNRGALLVLALALCGAGADAQGAVPGAQGTGAAAFFKNRSQEQLASLDRGEVVVGKLADWKKMGLGAAGPVPDRLRARIAKLRPNYATEFMAVLSSSDGGLEGLKGALTDVKAYLSMVYHSKQYDSDLRLFDKMLVRSRSRTEGGEIILTSQHMQPFEDFESKNETSLQGDDLYFASENQSTLRYFGFSAVPSGEMVWTICARRAGEKTYFYGIGGMRAFDLLGAVRTRLENSFIGRVESFMKYMYAALKGAP